MAIIMPPGFTKGRQYSAKVGNAATARAVATSNCSRNSVDTTNLQPQFFR